MDGTADVARALRTAAPHALPEVLGTELSRLYGAASVTLALADYSKNVLQSLSAGETVGDPHSVHDGARGRAFGSQEPCVEEARGLPSVTVHVPVSVRGDRLGVLSVELPAGPPAPALLADLAGIAEALGHEIVVAGRDTDRYVRACRAARLTLAAEMQWHLLPGSACARPEYALGAQLEPAYAVHGDNYDWSASAEHLTLTVTNGMGVGIDAAMLTSLAINAMRNARRAGLAPADQARLADQAVFGQHAGRAHLAALLMRFELATGRVEAVDAGSPRLWRLRDGAVERITFDAQLPLGMFEETAYVTENFAVVPGDRLLLVTDGVYDAPAPQGRLYGDHALGRALVDTQLVPPSQVPHAVLRQIAAHRGDAGPADDALVVCLDWHGRPD